MIRLEINGQQVAISHDTSFDFYDYNSIFDVEHSRGAFTYDFDIDLREAGNARLYHHFNRINSTSVFTGRTARLEVDGRVLIEGKEVVLETNGDKVKIQIVGGNSEVNANGDTLRMSDLDLGELPEYTAATALQTLNAEPLSVPAVCTPVMVDYEWHPMVSQNVERETVSKMVNLAEYTDLWSEQGSWHGSPKFIGQPYLVIVVERVLEALGWNVSYNVLRTMEYAKRMIIVHGYETREICQMLPNWTVNEFLEEVQRMFNVIVVLNEIGRIAQIHKRDTFYNELAATIEIDGKDIIHSDASPGRKLDSTEEYIYNYDFVKYDLPSKTYGFRGDLSDDVKQVADVQDFTQFSDFNSAASSYRSADFYNKAVFLRETQYNTKWMLAKNGVGGFSYHFVRVDHFAHAHTANYEEGKSTQTVLKIVPAETIVMSIFMTDPSMVCGVVVPYAQQSGVVGADFTTNADYGLNQWVEGSPPKANDTSSEKLYVAQFLGRTNVLAESHNPSNSTYERYATAMYPQVYTHRFINGLLRGTYMESWQGDWRDYILDALWNNPSLEQDITFDLSYRLNTTYADPLLVNAEEVHTIYFKTRGRYNVAFIYNIAGRRFVCISLQYVIRNCRLEPYAIGKFLPLK